METIATEWNQKSILEITEILTNLWKLSNTVLKNQWVKENIIRKLNNILSQIKTKAQHTKNTGHSKSVPRGKFTAVNTFKKGKKELQGRERSPSKTKLYTKEIGKKQTEPNLPEGSKWARAEINKIENGKIQDPVKSRGVYWNDQ